MEEDEYLGVLSLGEEPKNIQIATDEKVLLTIYSDRRIEFNREEHPEWLADDFAREFVDIVERITWPSNKMEIVEE